MEGETLYKEGLRYENAVPVISPGENCRQIAHMLLIEKKENHDIELEAVAADCVTSGRAALVSSTPCPLHRGQELRPVVNH